RFGRCRCRGGGGGWGWGGWGGARKKELFRWLPPAGSFVGGAGGRTGPGSAAGLADLMAPLQSARERGAFGSVDGRAYVEAQRGGGQPTPYPDMSVLLMPRSAQFDSELDGIKASYRDSIDALLEAEPRVRTARVAFERALI